MERTTHKRMMVAFAPILLVLLMAAACVPSPPRYDAGGSTSTTKAPVFIHTLGPGRATNDRAIVRYLQDKLNILFVRWGGDKLHLPGHNGPGTYDRHTVIGIVWARQKLNRHLSYKPFSSTASNLLGKYGYDLIVAAAAQSVPSGTPTTTPPTTPPTAPPTTAPPVTAPPRAAHGPAAPASGALLGTWIAPRGSDWTQATQQSLLHQREAAAGRKYDISHNFYPFTTPFPTWREPWNISQGRIPMVSWNGTYTTDITSGRYDDMIRQRAVGMRNLGAPAFLRFYWEMDGAKKTKWASDPAAFIAAWRHVHQIFDSVGATNVAWVWCPNAWAFDVSQASATRWYPGDESVDWICADGYNWAPVKARAKWTSFETVFRNFYRWASTKDKPLMIGEFGAMEGAAGQKAQWYDGARTALKTEFTKIKAIVYYDEYRHEDNTIYDWRLDSSASSYAAWNNLAGDPYFNQR